jgi:hypothetical protein
MESFQELLGHSNMTITQESYGIVVQKWKEMQRIEAKLLSTIWVVFDHKRNLSNIKKHSSPFLTTCHFITW